MRFLDLKSKTAARDITSKSYVINVVVSDVSPVHIERLSKAIERILRKGAESILLATNSTVSEKFDCACAVRYPTAVNKRNLQDSLRSRHILPCFGEAGAIGNRVVHVDAKPTEDLDDSALRGLADLWSRSPWTMIYKGAGAAAGRTASGLHFPLPFCLNLAQSPQSPPKFSSS
jgi:hypothetical protein